MAFATPDRLLDHCASDNPSRALNIVITLIVITLIRSVNTIRKRMSQSKLVIRVFTVESSSINKKEISELRVVP